MTEVEKNATKEKIMDVAEALFSRRGFEGTSVREIAKESGANIASINYYFKNKHGLYWAVMDKAHLKLEEGVREATTRVDSVEDLAIETLNFILKEKRAFRNALKMMVGEEGIPEPDGGIEDLYCSRQCGPPGGQYFGQMLENEVKTNDEAMLQYGVMVIFSLVVQWGILLLSPKFPIMQKADPTFNKDSFDELIRHHCRATIQYMKKPAPQK